MLFYLKEDFNPIFRKDYLSSSSWKKNLMEVYFFHGKYDGKEEKIIYKYQMQICILQIHVQFIYIQLTYNMYVKNLPASAGDTGLFPELERCPGGGNGNLVQCSCLENPMDRGAWRATAHGVAKSQWLSD